MTLTLPDFINILTLLLVVVILVLIRQLGQRRSRAETSHHSDAPALSSQPPRELIAPAPDELEQRKRLQKQHWEKLTIHQRHIAKLAAEGKQNGEIAHALGIRSSTVSTHLKSIYKILEIHSRRELSGLIQNVEG